MNSRNSPTPSVSPYCSALPPRFSKTSSVACSNAAIGNSSAAGKPPPNEIIPGRCAYLMNSRTVLRRILSVVRAHCSSQFIRVFCLLSRRRRQYFFARALMPNRYRVRVMELRQRRYFATVARELRFTRAAARLHVAQPALSRQVKQLEDELGVALLHCNRREVILTPRGQSFLAEAESILQQTDRAMQRARATQQRSVNIGYVWGLFHSAVPQALQKFRALDPAIAVNLFDMSAAEQGKALSVGRLDVGFIGLAFEAESERLEKNRVGSTNFVIALPE